MLKRRLKRTVIFVCAAMLAVGAVGAGNTAFGAPSDKASNSRKEVVGRLLVSAGPDILISYDKNGTVLKMEGIDESGKKFLEGQEGYVGESCKRAMRILIRRLDEKGWFGDGTDIPKRSLIVKTEKGSEYPDDDFLEKIEEEIRDVADRRDIRARIKVVGANALDDKGYIDRETAEKIVLDLFDLKANNLKIKEYELDDGVYEIEVIIHGVEHEVELNAVTGEVLDVNRDDDHDGYYDDDDRDDDDHDDDRNDDDRYDDGRDGDDRDDDDRGDSDHDEDDQDDDDSDDDNRNDSDRDDDDRDDDDHDDDRDDD